MAKDDKPLVPGNHLPPDPTVTEGGVAPAPNDGAGHMKASHSRASAEGRPHDGTSTATQGKSEHEHAAVMGANKPQSERSQRKG